MKKRLISIILTVVTIFSLTLSTGAVNTESSAEPTSAGITFSGWTLNAIRIPNSTSMLSTGVVDNGIITYQATIRLQVKNNGSNYANQNVSWSTTAPSSNAVIVSKDSKTSSTGVASITFHVRGIEQVPVKITCGGKSSTVSIDLGTRATYLTDFRITQYITAREADSYYTGNKISVSGLTGTYKSDFIDDVILQGSGYAENGRYVKYYNGVFTHEAPVTALGYTPTAGTTIATDPYYIPCVIKNGTKYSGYVTIIGIGDRKAQDRGGAINGFDIDIYTGIGRATVDNSLDGYYRVLFNGVNSWGRDANNAGLAAISDEETSVLSTNVLSDMLCTSLDNKLTAYVSSVDYSKANAVTVSVVSNNASNVKAVDNDTINISLARPVLNVDNMELKNNTLVTIGRVNPSLQIYQEFDLDTEEVLREYYGYGFIETSEGVFYIQAPQHFSGVNGRCRIMNAAGDVIYESSDDVVINNSLVYNDGVISFTEYNEEKDQYINKSICTNNRLSVSMNYYE